MLVNLISVAQLVRLHQGQNEQHFSQFHFQWENVPLLLSKDENMDAGNKSIKTYKDCGKETLFPHSRTIQEIIENSADSGELTCSQNKSLPDIGISTLWITT